MHAISSFHLYHLVHYLGACISYYVSSILEISVASIAKFECSFKLEMSCN